MSKPKQVFYLTSAVHLPELIRELAEAVAGGEIVVSYKRRVKQRSLQQNAASHLLFQQYASKLRAAGITQKMLLNSFRTGLELDCTDTMIKDLFRAIGKKMHGKESTAKLTTVELQETYLAIDRAFSETHGISCPFPSQIPEYEG